MSANILTSAGAESSPRRSEPALARLVPWAPLLTGGLAVIIGVLALLRHAWLFSGLIELLPALQWVKLNTALCLIALGTGLITTHGPTLASGASRLRALRLSLAIFAALVGLASAAEYLFDVDLHIDQLLIQDIVPDYPVPGRMGLNTAVCMMLLGTSLALIDRRRWSWLAQVTALLAGATALFVLVGHALGLEASLRVALVGLMSPSTATAVLLISIGVWCVPTTAGILQKIDLPASVVAVGVVALTLLFAGTARLYFQLSTADARIAEQAFALETEPIAEGIARYIDQATQTLSGARGLFAASDSVSRRDWNEYVTAHAGATAVPGIMGVGFSKWIEPAELAAHEREVRAEGLPQYRVGPEGPREAYTSILYLEPYRGQNLRAIGYDMYSEPVRRAAMQTARRTDKPALSGSVQLVQNEPGDTQPGFLLYVPVYGTADNGREFLGFAYSPIRLADFVGQAVTYVRRAQPQIGFELADAAEPQRVLYRFPEEPLARGSSLFESRTRIQLAQRDWVVHFFSLPRFENAYRSLGPSVTLYVGTLLSLALVVLALLLFGYRAKAHALSLRTTELSYQLAFNRGVTEQMADPVIVMDMNERVTFMNAAAEHQLGHALADMLGKHLHATLHYRHADGSEFPVEECPIMRTLIGESLIDYETVYIRKDGKLMDVLISATPLFAADRQVGAVIVAHDITARKRTAEALILSNQELQRFAYVASHDLQTPLRSIASFTQLLEQALQKRLAAGEADWMQRIVRNVRKMEGLVAALLAHARVDASVSAFVSVDLNEIAGGVLDMLHPEIEESRATIDIGMLPVVTGDATQLAQVLQNLIGNALKYRGERPCRIEVRSQRRGAEHFVSVRDNGIGIDPQHHARIFEPFRRLHTQRSYPGTGVGLAICRRVIERHGGRMWVESARGEGSTFWFTLPAVDGNTRSLS